MSTAFAAIGFDYSIDQDVALPLHLAGLFGHKPEGYAELRAITSDGRVSAQKFIPAGDREAIAAAVDELKHKANVYMGAVIRREQSGKAAACGHSRALWVDGDTPESVDRIMAASPSWVVETSPGRAQGYWEIKEALAPQFVRQANLRLAAHLGADLASCDVARILRVPGTFNMKHDPPEPVRVVAMTIDTEPPNVRDLVGHLPDPEPARSKLAAVAKVRPIDPSDPFHSIPASEYVPALTRRPVNTSGYVTCPWHKGGAERTPSLRAYDDPAQGWFCWGCEEGGDVFTFAARLYGLDSRKDFPEIKKRLAGDLLAAVAA